MPFFDGYELISYALNEENEEKLFIRWVVGYQSVMNFDEFKNQMNLSVETRNDNRSEEEIFEYVLRILG